MALRSNQSRRNAQTKDKVDRANRARNNDRDFTKKDVISQQEVEANKRANQPMSLADLNKRKQATMEQAVQNAIADQQITQDLPEDKVAPAAPPTSSFLDNLMDLFNPVSNFDYKTSGIYDDFNTQPTTPTIDMNDLFGSLGLHNAPPEGADRGRDASESVFFNNSPFNESSFSDSQQTYLQDLLTSTRQGFTDSLNSTFTGDAFGDIDDNIINSILDERQGPASQQVGNQVARGNFNALGGQTANAYLDNQRGEAETNLRSIGSGIQSQNQFDANAIRDRGQESINNFKLGDDLFDVQPFADERNSLIDTRNSMMGDQLRSAVGNDPLFDLQGALASGGQSQGLVSGGTSTNTTFLDNVANKLNTQGTSTDRSARTSSGSGAF
jgi:hypothetical protein